MWTLKEANPEGARDELCYKEGQRLETQNLPGQGPAPATALPYLWGLSRG